MPRRVGAPRKWRADSIVYYNYPVPKFLDEKLNVLLKNINKDVVNPITKDELRRAALIEYIERRPELLKDE